MSLPLRHLGRLCAAAWLLPWSAHAQIERPEVLPRSIMLAEAEIATADAVLLSADFVDRVMHGLPVREHLQRLQGLDPAELQADLDTRQRQLAFWINIYNAYTQHFLRSDPSLYLSDRPAYFAKPQVALAGAQVSLEDIEHGVLRRGATIWTLGHLRVLWTRSAFIRRFAVDAVDYRIHFALNCGARSCPPVMPYREETLDAQLDAISADYLRREVMVDAAAEQVQVPALLLWFSADFGGSAAAKRRILQRHGILLPGSAPSIRYLEYDWTLHIENYAVYAPTAASSK